MKHRILALLLTLSCLTAGGADYRIRDIRIDVSLYTDGSAGVTEVWDVDANAGTEWYLVRTNLGDIRISGFSVSEGGTEFTNIGEWDIDASRHQKAGKCGITGHSGNGYELCWGIGEYGSHVFTVRYAMSNAVKSLNDFDMLHMQLVSPGLSADPEHVCVRIRGPESFSSGNTRIWGFGFDGNSSFPGDGTVVFESSGKFRRGSSVIVLLRFDKGIFGSQSIQNRNFEEVLDGAMDGAGFEPADDGEDSFGDIFGMLMAFLMVFIAGSVPAVVVTSRRRTLGCRIKDVTWCRDVPFGGDIVLSWHTLGKLGLENRKSSVAAAMILRMVRKGIITVGKDAKGRIEMSFNDAASLDSLNAPELQLLRMMRRASGTDNILQKNEFSRWAKRNTRTITAWDAAIAGLGRQTARSTGISSGRGYTPSGQAEARKLVGLRKYLKDFTMMEERGAGEVGLWQDYLVFAAMFGIADEVAEQLKEINPQAFEEVTTYDYWTMREIFRMTHIMAESITNAKMSQSAKAGLGGATSFGGGGGFSGGGFGGGGR